MTTKNNAANAYALIDLESRNRGKNIAKPRSKDGEYWLPIQIRSDDSQRLTQLTDLNDLTEQQQEELAFIKDRACYDIELDTDHTIKSRKHRLFYLWHKSHRNINYLEIWPMGQLNN